jgi:predicted permease
MVDRAPLAPSRREGRPTMIAVIDVVLPVFAIILAGYAAGRFRWLGEASTDALNRFVYYCALPALFFGSLARIDPSRIFEPSFLAAYTGGQLLVFAAAFVLARIAFRNTQAEAGLFAMGGIFANSGYIGVPLALVAFGAEGMPPAIVATVFMSMVFIALVTILIEADPGRRADGGRIVGDVTRAVYQSPLVMSGLVGVLWSLTGVGLPTSVATFFDLLGTAAGPCALFAIGLFLVGKPIRQDLGEAGAAVAIKLLVHPFVTWVLAFLVFPVESTWATVAVVMAAMPSGANCFVVAQRYGVYVQRASSGILMSTALSVVTVSILFSFWIGN